MPDIIDRATEHEEELRADALQGQALRAGLKGKTFMDSARNCRVCDEPINEGRRRAVPGVQTCVSCQQEIEDELRLRAAPCHPLKPRRKEAP